jgi:hypothetical protein
MDKISRKTAGKYLNLAQLGMELEKANLSIVQVLTGIQGDLERFLETY